MSGELYNIMEIYGGLDSNDDLIIGKDPNDILTNDKYAVFIMRDGSDPEPHLIQESDLNYNTPVETGVFYTTVFTHDPNNVSPASIMLEIDAGEELTQVSNPTYLDIYNTISSYSIYNALALYEGRGEPQDGEPEEGPDETLYEVVIYEYINNESVRPEITVQGGEYSHGHYLFSSDEECTLIFDPTTLNINDYDIAWSVVSRDNGSPIETAIGINNPSCSFYVNTDIVAELHLTFKNIEPQYYNVKATCDPESLPLNIISGMGEYRKNTTCTLVAHVPEEYYFIGWYEKNSNHDTEPPLSTSTRYSFQVLDNIELIAKFAVKEIQKRDEELNYTVKFYYKGNLIEMKWNPTVTTIHYS